MAFSLKIDGNYLPSGVKVKTKTLEISYDNSGTRGILRFTLIDENLTGTLFYFTSLIGKLIQVYENGTLLYGGMIDLPKTRKINQKPMIEQLIVCVDHHKICDRILVNQSYPKYIISDLVKQIIDTYLSSDGIWYDNSSIETTISEISINCPYIYCSNVFNELASLIGWEWKIGPDKKFYFNSRTSIPGPQIHESYGYLAKSLIIHDDISEYRNKEIIKDVNAITDELTETASPNPNNNRSYYVRFKINQKPKIYITTDRDNPQESELVDPRYIGINGLDTNMYWYWSKGDNNLTQDNEQALLSEGFFIVVKYYGQYQINIVEEDSSAIADRISVEGGSGLYEHIEPGVNIEGILIAEDKANALLDKYAHIAKTINLSSYVHDFKVGQICDTIFPTFGINSLVSAGYGYLVSSLKINDTGCPRFLRTVTLTDGQAIGGWVNFYKEWMSKTKDFEIRENALVEIPIDTDESQEWSGEVNMVKLDCLYPSLTLYPSNSLYPGTIDTNRTFYD